MRLDQYISSARRMMEQGHGDSLLELKQDLNSLVPRDPSPRPGFKLKLLEAVVCGAGITSLAGKLAALRSQDLQARNSDFSHDQTVRRALLADVASDWRFSSADSKRVEAELAGKPLTARNVFSVVSALVDARTIQGVGKASVEIFLTHHIDSCFNAHAANLPAVQPDPNLVGTTAELASHYVPPNAARFFAEYVSTRCSECPNGSANKDELDAFALDALNAYTNAVTLCNAAANPASAFAELERVCEQTRQQVSAAGKLKYLQDFMPG